MCANRKTELKKFFFLKKGLESFDALFKYFIWFLKSTQDDKSFGILSKELRIEKSSKDKNVDSVADKQPLYTTSISFNKKLGLRFALNKLECQRI